jgi:hypothetical protein
MSAVWTAMGASEWMARHPLFHTRLLWWRPLVRELAVNVLFLPATTGHVYKSDHSGQLDRYHLRHLLVLQQLTD